MKLTTLLSKLSDIGVTVVERSQFPEIGLETITLSSKAVFPFPENYEHWHVLTVGIGQETIDREEVESIQRHLWKASDELFHEDDGSNLKAFGKGAS